MGIAGRAGGRDGADPAPPAPSFADRSIACAAAPSDGRIDASVDVIASTTSASHAGQSVRTVRTSGAPVVRCHPTFAGRSPAGAARRPASSSQATRPSAYTSADAVVTFRKRSGAM
jgi:hypothetical protein